MRLSQSQDFLQRHIATLFTMAWGPLLSMAWGPTSFNGLRPTSFNQLSKQIFHTFKTSNGLRPTFNGLWPTFNGLRPTFNMASGPLSTLLSRPFDIEHTLQRGNHLVEALCVSSNQEAIPFGLFNHTIRQSFLPKCGKMEMFFLLESIGLAIVKRECKLCVYMGLIFELTGVVGLSRMLNVCKHLFK